MRTKEEEEQEVRGGSRGAHFIKDTLPSLFTLLPTHQAGGPFTHLSFDNTVHS